MAEPNPPPPRERDDQKRRKLSSPPSMAAAEENPVQRDALFDASHKVYLFALIDPVFNGSPMYLEDVYVLDLYPNADGNPNPNPNSITVSPALRFHSDYVFARIVVDSKLYFFEGAPTRKEDPRSVHVYDLSSSASSSYLEHVEEPEVVFVDKMDSLPSMHTSKLHPSAILTPNRRSVLVFSTLVNQFTIDRDPESPRVDFELFDLVSHSWLRLPSLPDLRGNKNDKWITIVSYYFKGATTFFVHTKDEFIEKDSIITLSLDLEDLDKGWEVCGKAMTPSYRGEVVAVDDALAASASVVYDVPGNFRYYIPKNPNVKQVCPMIMVAVLDSCCGGDWENQVCILTLNYERDRDGNADVRRGNIAVYPEIFIDVYELKSVPHSGGEFYEPILAPTKKRSHKFDLNVAYWNFDPVFVFPARATFQMIAKESYDFGSGLLPT